MSQEIIERQLAASAWGMTAATITQVRTLLDFGVRRLILANTASPGGRFTTMTSHVLTILFVGPGNAHTLISLGQRPRDGGIARRHHDSVRWSRRSADTRDDGTGDAPGTEEADDTHQPSDMLSAVAPGYILEVLSCDRPYAHRISLRPATAGLPYALA